MIGAFMMASAVANAVGALIGGALLDLDGLAGLAGWQWVFVATDVPAVLLAPYVLLRLPDGPVAAPWLSPEQKSWIADTLRIEAEATTEAALGSTWRAMLDRRVLLLAVLYVGFPLAAYGLSYWLLTVVKGFGVSNTVNGMLDVILWILVGIALWLLPRQAAQVGHSPWHIAGPALVGAACLALSVAAPGPVAQFALLCIAGPAIFAAQPMFWSLPPTFLRGAGAAAGIAAINAIGNLGGFVAPTVVPALKQATGSDILPMLFPAACLTAAAGLVFVVLPQLTRAGSQRQSVIVRPSRAEA